MGNESIREALFTYSQSADNWQSYLAEQQESAGLEGDHFVVDLSGLDLTGIELHGHDLANANLKGANFTNAVLNECDLSRADCASATFEGASLRGTRLTAADFGKAILSNANMFRADLKYASFEEADLTHTRLASASALAANFSNANLANADLSSADFSGSDFSGATLSNSIVRGTIFRGTNLHEVVGLRFDESIVAQLSPGTDEPWTTLCRRYTGTRLYLTLVLMLIFIAPRLAELSGWVLVDSFERSFLESIASSPLGWVPVDESSGHSAPGQILRERLQTHLEDNWREVPLPLLLVFPLRGFMDCLLVLVGITYVLFVVLQGYLTYTISSLFDEQQRTGRTPPLYSRPKVGAATFWKTLLVPTCIGKRNNRVKGYAGPWKLHNLSTKFSCLPWLVLAILAISIFQKTVFIPM